MRGIKSEADFDFANVYSLVSEPEQYDAFMQSLLEKLGPGEMPKGDGEPHLLAPHWGKASLLIDKVTPWRVESQSELDKFLAEKMQTVMAFDHHGKVVGANPAVRSFSLFFRRLCLSCVLGCKP